MSFDRHSKLGDLLASEAAKEVLEKHLPGFATNPMAGMASGFTLSQLAAFPQANISSDVLEAIVSDLASLTE
jgi:hypothetical protein